MPKTYKIGDLVWAKIKNCSPWPSRVTVPIESVKKSKKNATFVCFFGTHDYAWVDDENIKPYLEFKPILATSSKSSSFKKAVAEIDEYIEKRNSDPNFEIEKENEIDSEFNRLKEEENEKPVTPKKRKMSGTKRNSESSKLSSAKKRKSTPTENGASSSYSSSVVTRNYEEILNRPAILDVPSSPTIDINNVSDALKSKQIEPSNLTFGFLGLGIMGSGIVKNLINSGHKVNLWNRSSRKVSNLCIKK
ncbi:PWWP domain [Popillia japonica]|uniref:PWWP domain n=1 Tax=Popillia japonica TaxID=7064 RepID=A0AAW1N1U3_POPJA